MKDLLSLLDSLHRDASQLREVFRCICQHDAIPQSSRDQSNSIPNIKAKNDTVEFNADYAIAPSLTLVSQTGYNQDFLWSTEDYDRFTTAPGAFVSTLADKTERATLILSDPNGPTNVGPGGPNAARRVCKVGGIGRFGQWHLLRSPVGLQ